MKIAKFTLVALALLAFLPTRPARADQIKQFDFDAYFLFFNVDYDQTIEGIGTIDVNTNFINPPGYYTAYVAMWVPLFNQFFAGGGYLFPESNGAVLQAGGFTMDISAASFSAFWQSGGHFGGTAPLPNFLGGTVAPTPEPSTLPLFATGLLSLIGLGALRGRQLT
jgi:hypothetical protein